MIDFWKKRWEEKNIPWHQAQVEGFLKQYFSSELRKVFVPLCGKSLDLQWLAGRGCEVVGSELSEIACRDFFEDLGVKFKVRTYGSFKIFESDQISLWSGDFFELPLEEFSSIDSIYDRAALFALPPGEIRDRYAARIAEMAGRSRTEQFQMLLIGREIYPDLPGGPPYTTSKDEIEKLYGRIFEITELEKVKRPPRQDLPGEITETCYRLSRKSL